jgi:hypothetical protein
MVAEPTQTTYSNDAIASYIETYPRLDEQGNEPYTLTSDTPPEREVNTAWIPTYDLNAAAADIWEEKAAAWTDKYDFTADGGNYSRSQAYDMCMKQCRYYRARRMPTSSRLHKYPDEGGKNDTVWIGNMPESD